MFSVLISAYLKRCQQHRTDNYIGSTGKQRDFPVFCFDEFLSGRKSFDGTWWDAETKSHIRLDKYRLDDRPGAMYFEKQ